MTKVEEAKKYMMYVLNDGKPHFWDDMAFELGRISFDSQTFFDEAAIKAARKSLVEEKKICATEYQNREAWMKVG